MRRAIVMIMLLVAASAVAAPKEKPKKGDQIWTHPDYAALGIESIAILPAASYDHDLQKEKVVDAALAQAVRGATYRWVSPGMSREMLRAGFKGDSVMKAIDESVLKNGRVDSLSAPALCKALRTDALLSVRLDQFEKLEMEFNQAGKPSTSVQLRAALVDSSGRALWTAWGSETMEGPYHDPTAGTVGVRGSGLGTTPITGQAGAPSYDEVMTKLLERWKLRFPPRTVAARDSTG